MKVLDLRCGDGHAFEGWFASDDDFTEQLARGDVACPLCASAEISRLPSAPRLQVSRHGSPAADAAPVSTAVTMQSQWMRAVRHVMANTEDVGDRFPDEARKMHYGETEERAIRGRASREDAEALRDEGIQVVAMPLPEAMKGPLQ